MKKILSLIILPVLIVTFVIIFLTTPSNTPSSNYRQLQGMVFGTIYHITYEDTADYHDEIRQTLQEFDASLSMFNPTSIISRFNNNDSTCRADAYFSKCFKKAQEISRRTGGAFDITVAPLVNLWGFGFKNSEQATPAAIDSIRRFVGYHLVSLTDSGTLVKKDPRVILDASSIAKGYACDVIADLLKRLGVKNYMVEIGGEISVQGVNAKGNPWAIGIHKPHDNPEQGISEIDNVLFLTSGGMATSGNYRNFYYRDGKRYAHTIDPKSGKPVQQDILSSTVIASDCMTADAYATAFMVLGKERSLQVLKADSTLLAYFIVATADSATADTPYEIVYSPRLSQYLSKE